MLHTKSRGNRSTGPGEEYVEGFLTRYGRGGNLGHVTQIPGKKPFVLPTHANLALIGKAVSEEKMFDWSEKK